MVWRTTSTSTDGTSGWLCNSVQPNESWDRVEGLQQWAVIFSTIGSSKLPVGLRMVRLEPENRRLRFGFYGCSCRGEVFSTLGCQPLCNRGFRFSFRLMTVYIDSEVAMNHYTVSFCYLYWIHQGLCFSAFYPDLNGTLRPARCHGNPGLLLSALEHFELPEHQTNVPPSRALWNCS